MLQYNFVWLETERAIYRKDGEDEWVKMEKSTKYSTLFLDKTKEHLMQKLFKEKLYDWLLYQIHEEEGLQNLSI